MYRKLLVAAIFMLGAALHAQETPIETLQPEHPPPRSEFEAALVPGWNVIVVTKSQPKVRHKCLVSTRDVESVTCAFRHNGQLTYRRADLAAIIHEGTHFSSRYRRIFLAVGCGMIAGSFFVPVVALPTILKVVGGFALLIAGNPGDDSSESWDQILWRNPSFAGILNLRS